MDILSVCKNIKKKGLRNTWKAFQKNKKKKIIEKKDQSLELRIADTIRNVDWENSEQRETGLLVVAGLMEEFSSRKKADKAVRACFIKQILPEVYREISQKPIEHKVVIMENGGPISPSLTYMRQYLLDHTDYKVETYTLQIRQVPDFIYFMNAKRYIEACATAEAIFNCTANILMGYLKLRPETTYIQLWHGCGAFKKCGLSTIDSKFGKTKKSHEEYPQNTNYSYVTIASPELSWVFEEMMGIEKDSGVIVPTGISRTDCFFSEDFIQESYNKLYEKIPAAKGKKVILYAPTFRGEVATCTSPDVLDVAKFAKALGDEYILIFKHHQSVKEVPPIPEEFEGTFAFDMTRKKGMTINELMTVADILISDYSSVVFEYALFERPMIFFTYDIDEYIDERGLYYNFEEITPGPMFENNEDIIDYIQHIDERFNKEEVIQFKEKFMCCCDGHSTERIVKLIGEKPKSGNM